MEGMSHRHILHFLFIELKKITTLMSDFFRLYVISM